MKVIKKISTKTVFGSVNARFLPEDGSTKELYNVMGIATSVQVGESNYGAWECLRGRFRAVNLATGEEVEAGQAFLPSLAHELVAPQVLEAQAVEFALLIGARLSANSPVGYEYTAEPLLMPSEADPISQLARRVEKARESMKLMKDS